MDEKKVREAISCINDLIQLMPSIDRNAVEHLETAIGALEKQLPKKVDAKEEYRDFHGRLLYYKGFCPDCGFIVHSYKDKYCPCCTQMLDWSEQS